MNVINVHEAKTNFSKLLDRAAHGERIIIGKAGKPIARLEPMSVTAARKS
jgi:prevent-host-death family protein